jgi:hypothetical protein
MRQAQACIRRRARRRAHAEIAAGAGLVLDVELLAQVLGELSREQACHDVGRSSRCKRHDHAHRPIWISIRYGVFCANDGRREHRGRDQQSARDQLSHPHAHRTRLFMNQTVKGK